MMDEELILRLALALERGSFTNDYGKLHAMRGVIRVLEAMTPADHDKLRPGSVEWHKTPSERFAEFVEARLAAPADGGTDHA